MTNINIDNNILTDYQDKFISIKNNNITFFANGEYNIDITNSTNLSLNINLNDNVDVSLFIKSIGNNIKIKTHYQLNKNSKVNLSKFYFNNTTEEEVTVNLNGENSSFTSKFSSICKKYGDYHIIINHNNKKTFSYISNKSIGCDNSKINFIIDSTLEKGNINCIMDQTTKILTLGEVDALIEPNMFIDDDSVEARHGSVIGTFSKDDLFYLMSRGIKEKDAIDLLLKGFIFSNLDLNMDNRAIIYECIKNMEVM